MRKILGVFEVCLGIFEKTKEKKDRAEGPARHLDVSQGPLPCPPHCLETILTRNYPRANCLLKCLPTLKLTNTLNNEVRGFQVCFPWRF